MSSKQVKISAEPLVVGNKSYYSVIDLATNKELVKGTSTECMYICHRVNEGNITVEQAIEEIKTDNQTMKKVEVGFRGLM